jgi:hypothetical protein
MKPRRQTTKICFQIIFLSLFALSSAQASEPSYNGKPLSEWLLVLEEGHMPLEKAAEGRRTPRRCARHDDS